MTTISTTTIQVQTIESVTGSHLHPNKLKSVGAICGTNGLPASIWADGEDAAATLPAGWVGTVAGAGDGCALRPVAITNASKPQAKMNLINRIRLKKNASDDSAPLSETEAALKQESLAHREKIHKHFLGNPP
jgi:hypothetical protein